METPDYFLVERMRYDIVYILGRLFIKVDRVIVGVFVLIVLRQQVDMKWKWTQKYGNVMSPTAKQITILEIITSDVIIFEIEIKNFG